MLFRFSDFAHLFLFRGFCFSCFPDCSFYFFVLSISSMDLRPRCSGKVDQLIQRGVNLPSPLTLDIGEEVRMEQISGRGVTIYPGCRIYGEKTVIASGAQIGYEGPVTIENCQIGPEVELKGGFFKESLFLEKASMGPGAQVREGCILEEQASGGHCVGLKQTILFPFVTLGSLINFCDCLMAGGTSRQDHSEVGSSYIHFNFTPDGDKTTPSLIGDVPRGVMLNQRPIFLGGQGGMVGPLRMGYGNVVAAGAILRDDIVEENKLIMGEPHEGRILGYEPHRYSVLRRIVENNVLYLANLIALEQWQIHVRRLFFTGQEFGDLLHAGAMDKLSMAKQERTARLKAMADKMPDTLDHSSMRRTGIRRKEFHDRVSELIGIFSTELPADLGAEERDRFLESFLRQRAAHPGVYVDLIRSLPATVTESGSRWLQEIVDALCHQASALLPSLEMFKK
jgi:bifunctional UDP-N-acetylglucosamine pyrophosphorylase/glucosamine-1-phosphate N-acetyltransferase